MNFSKNNLWGLGGFISVLFLWIVIYSSNTFSEILVPSPIKVLESFIRMLSDKLFINSFLVTLSRIVIAFCISAVIGISTGLICGFYKILNKSTEPLIDFLRSIPGIVLFPLFILFFGIGDTSRLLVAIFIALPIVIINTRQGVINSSEKRRKLYILYKLDKIDMFKRVIMPEASPYIFTGLKISLSLIIILVIVTEMMIGTKFGMGQLLLDSQYKLKTDSMYAIIIFLGVMGYSLNLFLNKIENKIFHWRAK